MTKKKASVLRKLNNSNEKNMSKKSNSIYTDMIIYLRFSELTLLQQEIVRADLIEMIIDGEARGENMTTILGGDYKVVCDEIISTFPPQSKKDKILNFISIISLSFSVMMLIFLLSQILTNIISKNEIWNFNFMTSYLAIFLLSMVAAWFFIKKVSKTAVKETNKLNKEKHLTKFWIFLAVVIGGVAVVMQDFLDQILFQTSALTMVGVIFFFFITHSFIERKTDY